MSIECNSLESDCGLARGGVFGAAVSRARRLESRFPSASKGLLSIFDQGIVSGTSFLTAAIIGRTTSPEELGLYYFVLSIVLVVSGIQQQLMANPYAVYSKRRQGRELAEYAGSVWLHHAAFTLLIVAGLVIAISVCSALGAAGVLPVLWTLLGAGPLLLLRDAIRRFTFANLEVKSAIILDGIVASAQLGGLLLLGYLGRLSLFYIYATMGAACLLACLGWWILARPRIRFNGARFLPDLRENWSFGKWALRSYLVGSTTFYVVFWILGLTVGVGAAGVFGACDTIIAATNILIFGVGNILSPLAAEAFAKGGVDDLRRILCNTASFLVLMLGGFSLLVLLTGDWLVVFVFGDDYRGSGSILIMLTFSALMTGIGTVSGSGLWAIDRPRANFVADAVAMSVTLVAAALLIAPFGEIGAAASVLAGTSAACVARTLTIIHHVGGSALEPNVAGTTQPLS